MNDIPMPSQKDRPVLQTGSKGAWVMYLQNALNGCGYGSLKIDGDFGENTTKSVKKFQKDLDLGVDGFVEEKTWEALDKHEKLPGYKPMLPRIGIAGADTVDKVNSAAMFAKATKLMGIRPQFWGRYFLGKEAEYMHKEENNVLFAAGIRVLPICRETNLVSGSNADGNDVGKRLLADVLDTFGEDYLASQGGIFYIFLDVEPDLPLSTDYYLGWSKAIVSASSKVKFLPGVYLNSTDQETSTAISNAMEAGAECHGLWLASYIFYKKNTAPIDAWDSNRAKPATEVPCPVLIHQYAGEIDGSVYDFNQINPFLDNPESLVLKRLILPQPVW